MSQCLLTTMDNPNNPFTHMDEWLAFDIEHRYMTMEWLGKFSNASSLLDEKDYEEETSMAIDRFLALNPFGVHIKVYDYDADVLIPLANKAFELMRSELGKEEGDSAESNPIQKEMP